MDYDGMSMAMYDVVAMGELLIDFTPAGISPDGNTLFERNPGGAPANVLVGLSRLGGSGCFLGMVGDDQFGRYLADVLVSNNVSVNGLVYTQKANTTLAFVHLDENGERNFSFYRRPGADLLMAFGDVDVGLIDAARIFHFGAVCLTDEPVRGACLRSAQYALENGVLVSFDPNWRPLLWESDSSARKHMLEAVELSHVLKVSAEEMELLTGESDPKKGSKQLLGKGPPLVFVTMGSSGCYFRCHDGSGTVGSYPVSTVDTTGAGDAFTAAILAQITKQKKPVSQLGRDEVCRMAAFANAAGALCVQKRGAIPAMPFADEVHQLLDSQVLIESAAFPDA